MLSERFREENAVMSDLIRAANVSNAAIYIVEPRGVMVGGRRSTWMESVAGETGGKMYRRNDVAELCRRWSRHLAPTTCSATPGPTALATASIDVDARTADGHVFTGSLDRLEGAAFSVTPGVLQLTIPDPPAAPLGFTTPAVFRTRSPLEWRS